MKSIIIISLLIQSVLSKPFLLYKKDTHANHLIVKRDLVSTGSNETFIYGTSFLMVEHDSDVESLQEKFPSYHVEEDKIAKVNLDWHLDRMDQRSLPLDNMFSGASLTNDNIDVYVLDTGVEITHQEFPNNQAIWGGNFADNINSDCHGHGTHVASTVAGSTVGISRGTRIIAVKVLGCNGSGSYSGIIQAISWVVSQAQQTGRLSIINMSLGGGYSEALTYAVREAFNSGVYVVVAAGNENDNACSYSPANVPEAITVAATDESDSKAWFSNWGSCVDVYAPGACLRGAFLGNSYMTMCGTSMASPTAAGVLAVYLSKLGRSGYSTFISSFTSNVVTNNPSDTSNKFVYLDSSMLSPPTSTQNPTPTSCVPSTVTATSTITSRITTTATTTLTTRFTTTSTRTLTATSTVTQSCSASPTQAPTAGCYSSDNKYFISKSSVSYNNAPLLCPPNMVFTSLNALNAETVRQLVVSCNGVSSSWVKNWSGSGTCLKMYSTTKLFSVMQSFCSYKFPVVCNLP